MPGTKNRTRLFVIALAFALAIAGIVACSSDTATGVPPTTGIIIRAETLSGDRGCGKGPTQLFKYAAIVYTDDGGDGASNAFVTSNLFDCYADGRFVALLNGGTANFNIDIFAYTEPAYRAASAIIDRLNPEALRTTAPSWTTSCKATQLVDVETLANCNPLRAGLSGLEGVPATRITLDTQTFNVNGQVANCVPPSDAGTDGAILDDAGEDAGEMDAGLEDADAAPPPSALTFGQVRVLPRIKTAVVGPVATLPCGTRYDVEVTPDTAEYELVVELLDPAGQALVPTAQTVCKVTSQVGQTSSAVCP